MYWLSALNLAVSKLFKTAQSLGPALWLLEVCNPTERLEKMCDTSTYLVPKCKTIKAGFLGRYYGG